MSEEKDQAIRLLIQAEELQKHAQALQSKASDAVHMLGEGAKRALQTFAQEIQVQARAEVQIAVTGAGNALSSTVTEAKYTVEALRDAAAAVKRSTELGLLKSAATILGVAIVVAIGMVVWGRFWIEGRREAAQAIDRHVQSLEMAAEELKGQGTLGLQMLRMPDGGYAIKLPKGRRFEWQAVQSDGTTAIVFK
jgi:F0F1-type ATP synthase membrane subunit b/b'